MNNEKIIDILKKVSGNSTDIYYHLYLDYFENDRKEAIDTLITILEYPHIIGDLEDNNSVEISKEEEEDLYSKFEEIILGISNRIARMELSKEVFYERLYDKIFCSNEDLFPQERKEKVIALKILSEKAEDVPYYQIKDGIEITRDEFNVSKERILPYIQEAKYMLSQYPFKNYPAQAAQIYRIMQEISNEKDKVIFLSMLISFMNNKNKQGAE